VSARLEQLEREVCRRNLTRFVQRGWPFVEPTRALLPSIAFDAIIAALTAVAEGRIKRLGIVCPPGVSKSKLAGVLFPAWLLLRTNGTSRAITGSYAHDLAKRDARATRDLVSSPWFASLVGGRWAARQDVGNKEDDWYTTATGRRQAVSTGSATTGERATIQIIDDLLSARDMYSPLKRKEAIHWLTQVAPSRLEDQINDPRVLIGQRLHPEDPMSIAIANGWRMLVLPAVLGPCPELGITWEDEPCVLLDDAGREVWRDPRKPGEPLVALLSIEALARLKIDMGSAAFAAQYLQRPHDDSNAMFPRAWFHRRWTELPEKFDRKVIALDATFRDSKTSDYCVIQCWGAHGGDRYLVEQWRRQAGFVDTLAALRAMAARHRYAKVLIEGRANGDAVFDALRRELAGVVNVEPEGGKMARAATVEAVCESGAVVLPENAPWVEGLLDELAMFPGGKHDDQVDCMVYALRDLQNKQSVRQRWRVLSS
jgi:predicted phage terminase large subunit-like protein